MSLNNKILSDITVGGTHFSREAIGRDMAELRRAVEPTVREDEYSDHREFLNNFEIPKDLIPSESGGGFRVVRKPLLREFVAKRHESIAAQWAGEREGYTPGSRRRPSGRGERRPRR